MDELRKPKNILMWSKRKVVIKCEGQNIYRLYLLSLLVGNCSKILRTLNVGHYNYQGALQIENEEIGINIMQQNV